MIDSIFFNQTQKQSCWLRKKKSIRYNVKLKNAINETDEKIKFPITVEDLLKDKVDSTAFTTVRRLLKIYILLPQSEAVVERGFSKMKLTMTKQHTSLDSRNLDVLMRLSYKHRFSDVELQEVIDIWKEKKDKMYFFH